MDKILTSIIIVIVLAATTAGFLRPSSDSAQSGVLAGGNLSDANPLPLSANISDVFPTASPTLLTDLQIDAHLRFLQLFGGGQVDPNAMVEPVVGFKLHATKKYFGTYITPETSPVEHDRFTGYHTGVDAEFTDTQEEISIRAIADGVIVARAQSHGYGGVIIVKHILGGVPIFALYGHLASTSFPPANITNVKTGDLLGRLGNNHSSETDGTRKHLHFSLYTGEKIDFRGYVQKPEELVPWLNPLDFYPN